MAMISQKSSPFEHFKNAPIGICIIDPSNNKISYCNDRFIHKVGKVYQEVFKKNYIEVLGANWLLEDQLMSDILLNDSTAVRYIENPNQEQSFVESLLEITYSRIQLNGINRPGIALWAKYVYREISTTQKALPVHHEDSGGLINQLSKSNSFLSEVNARLRENHENLESAFDAGNLGSCGINFRTGEVTLSARGRSFFGLSEDANITWEVLLQAVDAAYHDEVNKAFSDAQKHGSPVDSTYSISHMVTHEKRWIRVLAKVHRDQNGQPSKVFGLVTDITDQKTDEQRKNDFIAMASHELKTPLTAVTGYIQMLLYQLRGTDLPIVQDLLKKSVRQLDKIASMIDTFIDVTEFETECIRIQPKVCDFKTLMEDVKEDVVVTFPSHQIVFSPIPSISIQADRQKITQVMMNLIGNAVKFSSPSSCVAVHITIHNTFIKIDVKDQGIGMSIDEVAKIFNKFYRVERNEPQKTPGFGIGLYICHQIIEKHKGKIWAESAIGLGSVFSFTLPIE